MLRAADGRARPLLFDGSPLLPSAVFLDTDGPAAGRPRRRTLTPGSTRPASSPTRSAASTTARCCSATGRCRCRRSSAPCCATSPPRRGGSSARSCDELRLTHPARWGERRRAVARRGGPRRPGCRRPRLIARAGRRRVLLHRGAAAAPCRSGAALAIYDLGGGTFDATVVRRTPAGFEVLAEDGLQRPRRARLRPGAGRAPRCGRTRHAATQLWSGVVRPADPGERRQRALLYDDVRGAKEMLSRTTSADVHLPALDVDAHVTRDEFEGLIRPQLARTVALPGTDRSPRPGCSPAGPGRRLPGRRLAAASRWPPT